MTDINLTPTPVSEWKQDSGQVISTVTLPSGKVATIRRPGMESFISEGMIPNVLMGPIQEQLKKAGTGTKLTPAQEKKMRSDLENVAEELFEDLSKLEDMLTLADGVAIRCFVEPRVHAVPTIQVEDDKPPLPDPSRKDPNLLYVDEVSLEDKLFVFSFAVGGSSDLERFRDGLASSVGNVRPRKATGRKAQPTRKHK